MDNVRSYVIIFTIKPNKVILNWQTYSYSLQQYFRNITALYLYGPPGMCAGCAPQSFHLFQQTPSEIAAFSLPSSSMCIKCHQSYLVAGPFLCKISALWSRASSRPSSHLPLFRLSKLYYTLFCLTSTKTTLFLQNDNEKKRYKKLRTDESDDKRRIKHYIRYPYLSTYLSTWKSSRI